MVNCWVPIIRSNCTRNICKSIVCYCQIISPKCPRYVSSAYANSCSCRIINKIIAKVPEISLAAYCHRNIKKSIVIHLSACVFFIFQMDSIRLVIDSVISYCSIKCPVHNLDACTVCNPCIRG